MSDTSRYTRYHRKKLRKDKRILKLYGERDDRNRWYRCWNCGFQIDSEQTATGEGNGLDYSEVTNVRYPSNFDPNYNTIISSKDNSLLPIGGWSERHTIMAEANQGCPFCGTLNWR